MNYNFMNNPIYPGQPQQIPQGYQQMPFMSSPPIQMNSNVGIVPEPTAESTTGSSYGFTIIEDEAVDTSNPLVITQPMMPIPQEKPKRKRVAKKPTDDIVRASNGSEVVSSPTTLESYSQTSAMLEEAIREIDVIAVDLKTEMDSLKMNRNARNRAQSIANLGETIGRLLDSKISAIREINSTISKSNEMDYKVEKDRRAAQNAMDNDDRNIMSLYSALIHQSSPMPNGMATLPQQMHVQMYSDPNISVSPIVRASDSTSDQIVDQGYLNYLSNMTPEQNAMFYENDPNVQTVVVFDHSNGHKFFQVMNVATGQVVPNVPVPDQRFMDDTYLDLKTMTAKNSNLNITYPIVEINKGITSEY